MDDAAFKRRIGSVLSGKWRLDALLGTGGMASVYAATHVRNRLQTAVKLLHPELSRDEKLRQRFLREGYVANSVKHQGVVQVFDDSGDEQEAYIVMELLTGQTLKQRWNGNGRKLPLEEVRSFVSAILDVLGAAHAAEIVHRDLKPDNVFLTDTGTLKILDFGIARLREVANAHEQVTNTGALLGTPAFMPPEQAVGNWEEVDARADLFAVAATAWVLLTGQLVHQARGVSELLIAAATRKARPIKSLVENLPDSVAQVIDKSLAFDKADRYPTAEAMREAWDAAFIVARRAPTLRMLPPSSQAMLDWSLRPPAALGSAPPSAGAPSAPPGSRSAPTASMTLGALTAVDGQAGITPIAPSGPPSKAPSIPNRLFNTETSVSRDAPPRTTNRTPIAIAIAIALAIAAVAAAALVVATSRESAPSTASNGSTSAQERPTAPEPSTPPLIVPSPSSAATPPVAPSEVASTAPSTSSTPSASAAPSSRVSVRAPTISPKPAVPAGCETGQDWSNNGKQRCPGR